MRKKVVGKRGGQVEIWGGWVEEIKEKKRDRGRENVVEKGGSWKEKEREVKERNNDVIFR